MSRQTEMHEKPAEITIERLPDGVVWVTLRKNIRKAKKETGEGQAPQIVFTADETAFKFPAAQECNEEIIKSDFDAWWAYGESRTASASAPTVDERLSALETIAAALVNKGVLDNV